MIRPWRFILSGADAGWWQDPVIGGTEGKERQPQAREEEVWKSRSWKMKNWNIFYKTGNKVD